MTTGRVFPGVTIVLVAFGMVMAGCRGLGVPGSPGPEAEGAGPAAADGPAMGVGQAGRPGSGSAAGPGDAAATAGVAPSPTASPTATPDPVLDHPLSVERMRHQEYPGSDLVIEQTLEPGANYARYIASYESEGNKIYALLTIPNGDSPATGWPVIIFNHGYIPPAQYRTTERYVAYADAFARNGYIVLKSDYRGHGSSEGEARGGYGNVDYTVDVLNGMTSVLRRPDADPDRVGMWGHSMGGGITLRCMVVTDTIKAGVIWAGVVASYPDLFNRRRATQTPAPGIQEASATSDGATPDANLPWTRDRRGWRTEFTATFGTPAENPEAWAAISPNSFLAEISGPLQLHHGTADHSVPLEYSQNLQKEMEAAGQPSELFVYPGDDHNLASSLSLALSRSVAFFDEHVKDTDNS